MIAYDGVNTVTSQTPFQEANPLKIKVSIIPPEITTYPPLALIKLHSYITVPGRYGPIQDEAKFNWKVNEKLISEKPHTIWEPSEPGKYVITLNVQWRDLHSTDSIDIDIKESKDSNTESKKEEETKKKLNLLRN